jgi:hypothetical protein
MIALHVADKSYSSRRGVALIAAPFLLALLGLLIVAAVTASSMSCRATRRSLTDGPLLDAADFAAAAVLTEPSRFGLADLALQRAQTFDVPVARRRASSPTFQRRDRRSVPTGSSASPRCRIPTPDIVASDWSRTAWIARPPAAPFVARRSTTLSSDVVLSDTTGEPDCTVPIAHLRFRPPTHPLYPPLPARWAVLAAAPGVRLRQPFEIV